MNGTSNTMSSRNKILADIAGARYPDVPRPEVTAEGSVVQEMVSDFLEACRRNGTEIIKVRDRDAAHEIYHRDVLQGRRGDETFSALLVESKLGVAENGSVWLSEEALPNRVAPFACEHLCVHLSEEDLVPTMHHAYPRLAYHAGGNPAAAVSGFGVFIAGPSKTADIEQTLVTGAQGSKKHTIFFITST